MHITVLLWTENQSKNMRIDQWIRICVPILFWRCRGCFKFFNCFDVGCNSLRLKTAMRPMPLCWCWNFLCNWENFKTNWTIVELILNQKKGLLQQSLYGNNFKLKYQIIQMCYSRFTCVSAVMCINVIQVWIAASDYSMVN